MEKLEPLCTVVGQTVKRGTTMENSMVVLKKLKIELPCDPAIPLLGTYPTEVKKESQRDIHTPIFIAALFTTATR